MSDTIGSITGVLKLDASNWFAELERAKAAAEELRAVDPTIRVSTDTGKAVTDLTGLQAELDRLKAESASIKVTADTGHATADLTGLQAVVDRVAHDSASIRVTTEGTAHAVADMAGLQAVVDRIAQDSASIRVKVDGTAEAIAELGAVKAAEDSVGRSEGVGKVGKDAAAAESPVNLLGLAILGLGPALVPVAGAAVGVTAALGAMGGAGVLAFLGIRREIALGTDTGLKFSAQLGTLVDDAHMLEAASATAIAPAFTSAVSTLQRFMPSLSTQVGFFSVRLGQISAAGVDTVLTMFQRLQPVMQAGANYLAHFVQNIDGFAHSTAFQGFVDYAVANMPRLEHLLDSVLVLAGKLIAAFAPWGSVVLGAVQGLIDLLNALPTPLLTALVTAVAATYTAFQAWKGISIVIAAVTGALDAMRVAELGVLGPIGLIVAGVALLAGAFAIANAGVDKSALGVTAYSTALLNSNGHVTEAIQGAARLQIAHAGLTRDMQKAGITQDQLTRAISQGGTAYKNVEGALKGETGALQGNHMALSLSIGSRALLLQYLQRQRAGVEQAVKAYNEEAKAAGLSTIKTGDQLAARVALAHAYGMSLSAYTAAAGAEAKVADSAELARNKLILEGNAAGVLKLDLDRLSGAAISNAEAQAAWASGLDSLKSSFNAQSKAITGNSHAAIENRGAIAGIVSTGETALESFAQQTHSVSQTTAKYREMRGELINQIGAITGNRAAAKALVDEFFKIPKDIKTDFKGNDADAKAKLAEVKRLADQWSKTPHDGKLSADDAQAVAKAAHAKQMADAFAKGLYDAKLTGNNSDSVAKTNAAMQKALGFSKGQYEAFLKANNLETLAKTADSQAKAQAFAKALYMAVLKANPGPANQSARDAQIRAQAFAKAFYQAVLKGDPNPAIAAARAAQAAIDAVHGKTVTMTVIHQDETINKRLGRATGGTIGMAQGGSVQAAAQGITAFAGSVYGPGTAASDTAGLFQLANGEEVISNMAGQASLFRRELKAINAGTVRTPQQLAQYAGGGRQAEQHVHVHITGDDSILAAAMRAEVQQGINAQNHADYLSSRMGRQGVRYG